MASLHDPSVRSAIMARLHALRPDATPRWGKMSVDQMLWHVTEAINVSLGERALGADRPPLPAGVMKFLVLRMPWMKGAPTNSALLARSQYDFDAERARCITRIEVLATRSAADPWPKHPLFGQMSHDEIGRLHAKHLSHHLSQFGA